MAIAFRLFRAAVRERVLAEELDGIHLLLVSHFLSSIEFSHCHSVACTLPLSGK
jgi:hypothetical protein